MRSTRPQPLGACRAHAPVDRNCASVFAVTALSPNSVAARPVWRGVRARGAVCPSARRRHGRRSGTIVDDGRFAGRDDMRAYRILRRTRAALPLFDWLMASVSGGSSSGLVAPSPEGMIPQFCGSSVAPRLARCSPAWRACCRSSRRQRQMRLHLALSHAVRCHCAADRNVSTRWSHLRALGGEWWWTSA